ncbi:MAG TPA: hypothetical protein DCP67_09125, partial [Planctomycetaceae bacterium]|nr:hypothetical protein [Planctomycetaceae bacterium]
MFDATASTDRLIELILEEDKDVFRQLLTTDKILVTGGDRVYLGKLNTKEERQASIDKEKLAIAEEAKKAAEALEAWKKANPNKEPPKTKPKK